MQSPCCTIRLQPIAGTLAAALWASDAHLTTTEPCTHAGALFINATQEKLQQYEDIKFQGLQGANARKLVLVVGIMAAHALGEGSGVGVSFCGTRGWAQVSCPSPSHAAGNIHMCSKQLGEGSGIGVSLCGTPGWAQAAAHKFLSAFTCACSRQQLWGQLLALAAHPLKEGLGVGASFCGTRGWAQVSCLPPS